MSSQNADKNKKIMREEMIDKEEREWRSMKPV